MEKYLEITIELDKPEEQEIWVARLADIGFDGFEEQKKYLLAYAPELAVNLEEAEAMLKAAEVPFKVAIKLPQNWNEIWESSFEPVVVENFAGVRAAFHPPVQNVQYDLVITPKMSFGTGHHATTRLMIEQMQYLDFRQKKVIDFGTGTGVLAILASKMGANSVEATDIDAWSVENAIENAEVNGCTNISIEQKGDLENVGEANIFLANINRNILRQFAKQIVFKTSPGGFILLSGLLRDDESIIDYSFISMGIEKLQVKEKDGWMSILYRKLLL